MIEELGRRSGALPISNSFPQAQENQRNNYNFYATSVDGSVPEGRWTNGTRIDGRGAFTVFRNEPLGPARADSGAEMQQIG